jgi:methylated-DNA-[protein]-cysteine S-methyltransferase
MNTSTSRYYDIEQLPHGWVAATCSDEGITKLSPPSFSEELALSSIKINRSLTIRRPTKFILLFHELTLYFDGKIENFSSPVDLSEGPKFFHRIWDICRTIPYGETRSYSWLASESGNPKAQRSVGQAMAHNPIPFLIPCHRVVRVDGQLGGYAWGLDLKSWLLNIENKNHRLHKKPTQSVQSRNCRYLNRLGCTV